MKRRNSPHRKEARRKVALRNLERREHWYFSQARHGLTEKQRKLYWKIQQEIHTLKLRITGYQLSG